MQPRWANTLIRWLGVGRKKEHGRAQPRPSREHPLVLRLPGPEVEHVEELFPGHRAQHFVDQDDAGRPRSIPPGRSR